MTINVQFIIVFMFIVLSNLTDMQLLTNKLLVMEPLSRFDFVWPYIIELRILSDQDSCKIGLKEGNSLSICLKIYVYYIHISNI